MASLASNPKLQLAATAAVSAVLTAAAVLSYQHLQRDDRVSRLKQSIPQPNDAEPSLPVSALLSHALIYTLAPPSPPTTRRN
jgi:hypothetical protein